MIARALAILTVSLLFILLAYTFIAYPIFLLINQTASNLNYDTPEINTLYKNSLMAMSVVGVISVVGLFIWLLAKLTKKEEFEWLR